MNKNKSIIFGSSGFIGQHLLNLLQSNYYACDINLNNNNTILCDVRNEINLSIKNISTIYNLAAIHKTPGHKYHEYFETNVLGAKNICNFADKNNINTIVFISSIAPYGAWNEEKDEQSMPMPTSPYGISKLYAEEIHKQWQLEKPNTRKLIILRPGVVFGPNENGNFTRLYKAIKYKIFIYPGSKNTKKAIIYVKDLTNIMTKMVDKEKNGIHLYNMAYSPIHTIKDICDAIANISNMKKPWIIIPSNVLKLCAKLIYYIGKITTLKLAGIHPDRIDKLIISTNINGKKVVNLGYKFKYTLKTSLEDWWEHNQLK